MDKRTEFVDSLKVDVPNEEELLKELLDKKYEEYAKKTPAYMNQELWLFAIFYLVIIVTNICLTTTIYI
mgnify:CR=1 FL=1